MSKKTVNKIEILKKEIEVKDKLIGALLHEISKKKISLPNHILKILDGLYNASGEHNNDHIPYDAKLQ